MELPLIVILGPTASGKTAYAIRLARLIGGEVICADSRTVYRGMDIGTAKPTEPERAGVPHWGLDLIEPDQRYSLYDFRRYATAKIAEIRQRQHVPLLVGGSGLYINSVIYDYQLVGGDYDPTTRAELEKLPPDELRRLIVKRGVKLPRDPDNKRRLIRSLERGGVSNNCGHLSSRTIVIGITMDKEKLSQRISGRAEQMLERGLIDEAERLIARYGTVEPLRRNAYGVVAKYLVGQIHEAELIEQISAKDRQLVKKQLTWWRNPRWAGDIMWRTLPELTDRLNNRSGAPAGQVTGELMSEYKSFCLS
ncbi:tRNA (adenosine(37)-N6)-dimethylallyltransferase MiaA [Candidatus Nanoperiomorbus periodonticus]|uniref:tRNA (adenosine(37)-N6)-dimethylallyltransferase MiaA n=1 Tax=Candidatus Nanoperiomorbus periodonticus TaxID=2171989 RepID=UPI00101D7E0E|nr:tRNA (adenosine(37)-N6)-dimethylallyltransferase MiaA [Candidatus Nanoperiomorbus periodonticus]RYC75556.1 tRNA dimethylallyltransferase [Candidatus Nanoperiomorbus periodonticus]